MRRSDSDFQSAGVTLNLPPGWRLFAAFGADEVPGTWLHTWHNLLDLFLMLITALATARLFGWKSGVLALTWDPPAPDGDGAPATVVQGDASQYAGATGKGGLRG